MMPRGIGVLAATTVVLWALALPVAAGGAEQLTTAKSSYEPGDTVDAVAYTGETRFGDGSGPLVASLYLPALPTDEQSRPRVVGQAVAAPTGLSGALTTRVYLAFELPTDMEPGDYFVGIQREDNTEFGYLMHAIVRIGLQASEGQYEPIAWAFDEPLIADLPDDALLYGPEGHVRVGELRAGRYPPGSEAYLMNPSVLDRPDVVIVYPTTTTLTDDANIAAPPTTVHPSTTPSLPAATPALELLAQEPITAEPPSDIPWLAAAMLGLAACLALALRRPRAQSERVEEQRETARA